MRTSTVKITNTQHDSGVAEGSAYEEAEVHRRRVVLYEKQRWLDQSDQRVHTNVHSVASHEMVRLGAYQDWWEERNRGAVLAADGNAWAIMSDPDHGNTLYLQVLARTHMIIHPDDDRLAGSWLKETRKDYGFTLKDLASVVGVQTPTVHRWESEAREASRGHIRKLQEIFRQQWEATAHSYDMKLLDRQYLLITGEPMPDDSDFKSSWFMDQPDLALQLVLETRIGIPEPPWVTHLPKAWRIGYESADPEYWSQHARTLYNSASPSLIGTNSF